MDQLQKQVARARRRLVMEQFLGRLVRCLLAALSVAVIAVAAPRLVAIADLPAQWDMAWVLGSLGAGFLVALVWTLISSRSPLDAAIEIDRRFDLRERIASSLSLAPEEQDTEAGQALVKDAVHAVSRIDVDDKFRLKLARGAWWPLVPAAIAFMLVMFVDNREAASNIDPNSAANAQKQTKKSIESQRKKIEELRKKSEEQQLKAAEDVFKKLEVGMRELSEKKDLDRTQAHVALNDLAKQFEERRQQMGGKDGLKEQFKNMKNLGAGPAEKAAQAMKQGDWKKALEEVEKLAKQLSENKLDPKAKEALAKQLQQMKEKLESANQAREQAMNDLKKQIEREQEKGNLAKAGELQQKLEKLQQQQQQMEQLQKLAQQMGQCSECLKQGDGQKAGESMAGMAQQLSEMQQQMDELEALDAAMAELEMTKDQMACSECNGEGCSECQGNGQSNSMNSLSQQNSNSGGKGIGKGRGFGRPDDPIKTNLRDTQVKQKQGKGAALFGGMVEGPNIKGEVQQSINTEMTALSAEPADPLTTERMPKSRRQHAEEYFKTLRQGK